MLVAALDGVDGLEASRIELDRDGPDLHDRHRRAARARPDRELFLVVGSDVAAGLAVVAPGRRAARARDARDRRPRADRRSRRPRLARRAGRGAPARAVVDRSAPPRRGRRADRLPRPDRRRRASCAPTTSTEGLMAGHERDPATTTRAVGRSRDRPSAGGGIAALQIAVVVLAVVAGVVAGIARDAPELGAARTSAPPRPFDPSVATGPAVTDWWLMTPQQGSV